MTTLQSASYEIAKTVGHVVHGTITTALSSSGFQDSAFPWYTTISSANAVPPSDHFNGGTAWILSSATGNAAGYSGLITDYVGASNLATFVVNCCTAIYTAGDRYAVTDREYPRYILQQAVNYAVQDIGNVPQYNSTGLTTVADQEQYTLPSGVYNVKRVHLASSTSTPFGYYEHFQWKEIHGKIYFVDGHIPDTTGYPLRLTYHAPIAELDSDIDTIPDLFNINYVKWAGAEYALRWRFSMSDATDKAVATRFTESIQKAMRSAVRYRPEIGVEEYSAFRSPWDSGVYERDEIIDKVHLRP